MEIKIDICGKPCAYIDIEKENFQSVEEAKEKTIELLKTPIEWAVLVPNHRHTAQYRKAILEVLEQRKINILPYEYFKESR